MKYIWHSGCPSSAESVKFNGGLVSALCATIATNIFAWRSSSSFTVFHGDRFVEVVLKSYTDMSISTADRLASFVIRRPARRVTSMRELSSL
jgi:hypothetical protein